MTYLPASPTPGFPDVYELAVDDPIEGGPHGVDNLPHRQLAERTDWLKHQVHAAHDALTDHEGRLREVEGGNVATFGRALPLSWLYSDEAYDFELFTHGADWRGFAPVALRATVAGDDSMDVDDASVLEVGRHYAVFNAQGSAHAVCIAQVLSPTRVLLTAPFPQTWTEGFVGRSNWHIQPGYALADDGQVLFSKTLYGLRQYASGRLIVRRDAGLGTLEVAYKAPTASNWSVARLLETRENAPNTRDETYEIGGGLIELRLSARVGAGQAPLRIEHLVTLTPPKAQMALLVDQPVLITPNNGAASISTSSPVLAASAYKSLYGVAQSAAQWQVATDDDFAQIVWQTTKTAAPFHSVTVGSGLTTNTTYRWRVRYQDADGVWSPWSALSRFATGAVFNFIARPSNIQPASGASGVAVMPTLQSSAFAVGAGSDTHSKSQWQIASDAQLTTVLYDSGEHGDLTTHAVTAPLQTLVTYHWRVRHKGASIGWSDWSLPTPFTVQAKPAQPLNTAQRRRQRGVADPDAAVLLLCRGGGRRYSCAQSVAARDQQHLCHTHPRLGRERESDQLCRAPGGAAGEYQLSLARASQGQYDRVVGLVSTHRVWHHRRHGHDPYGDGQRCLLKRRHPERQQLRTARRRGHRYPPDDGLGTAHCGQRRRHRGVVQSEQHDQ